MQLQQQTKQNIAIVVFVLCSIALLALKTFLGPFSGASRFYFFLLRVAICGIIVYNFAFASLHRKKTLLLIPAAILILWAVTVFWAHS